MVQHDGQAAQTQCTCLRGQYAPLCLVSQRLETVGDVLDLYRLDARCKLLLSLVQTCRLLKVMAQSPAGLPHRVRLYEKRDRGEGRQALPSAYSL